MLSSHGAPRRCAAATPDQRLWLFADWSDRLPTRIGVRVFLGCDRLAELIA